MLVLIVLAGIATVWLLGAMTVGLILYASKASGYMYLVAVLWPYVLAVAIKEKIVSWFK